MTVRTLWIGFIIVGLCLTVLGCADEKDGPDSGVLPEGPMLATCEGCHTNSEMLIATAKEDEIVESEGEG